MCEIHPTIYCKGIIGQAVKWDIEIPIGNKVAKHNFNILDSSGIVHKMHGIKAEEFCLIEGGHAECEINCGLGVSGEINDLKENKNV